MSKYDAQVTGVLSLLLVPACPRPCHEHQGGHRGLVLPTLYPSTCHNAQHVLHSIGYVKGIFKWPEKENLVGGRRSEKTRLTDFRPGNPVTPLCRVGTAAGQGCGCLSPPPSSSTSPGPTMEGRKRRLWRVCPGPHTVWATSCHPRCPDRKSQPSNREELARGGRVGTQTWVHGTPQFFPPPGSPWPRSVPFL